MTYCEMWLEALEKRFRVVLLVPDGVDVPEGFSSLAVPSPRSDTTLYGSVWHPSIHGAKDEINAAAEFYGSRSIQFLFFQEIRRYSGE
ncbi:MAG: hypothetical protein EAX95_04280 [Candidatus Thorarchaeota archaeon]|nr:hypothetical protein [Candidatus Thorarchaeota archaeon]